MRTSEARPRPVPATADKAARPRRRILAIAALVVVALGGSFFVWRATSLSGLPDIGDPFDLAEYTAHTIPDDQNAFVLYRQALAKFQQLKRLTRPIRGLGWGQLDPSQREWLALSRESIDLWRRATQRPDSLFIPLDAIQVCTVLAAPNRIRATAD